MEGGVPSTCTLYAKLYASAFPKKFAEKGVFKVRICMSANLGKRGLFWTENLRKSEERVLICCTMISYLDS